jgi:alcohol dehydrogenase class IV
MRFEFATASRIVFGAGVAKEAPINVKQWGNRCALVSGGNASRSAWLEEALHQEEIDTQRISIHGEPTVDAIRDASRTARDFGAQVVIAIGGGSVLDAGKAIGAMIANPGDPMDYLEVVGRGNPLPNRAAPCIAIPTTAGTGSEVTRNSVLGSPEHGVKASLRSPGMLPALAIVDPELTLDLPPSLTAATGLDALTQLIEPLVCKRANPMTDVYCEEGIRCVARSLRTAYIDGSNLAARTDMAWASLLGGLSLANAGLGAVHGFAAPIGGAFPAPHGAVCAALLPHAMRFNVSALRKTDTQHPALARYQRVAALLCGDESSSIEDGIAWVEALCADFSIPTLSTYGITSEHLPQLAEKASRASSMKANPVALGMDELVAMVAAAL